jgi:YhcH/YjgK/YiaL family protein
MILDKLSNAASYTALHPLFAAGFRFIAEKGSSTPAGRYELEGGAYAMVQEYETKPVEDTPFEAHRRFIDIQALISGDEIIYYANTEALRPGNYLSEKDYIGLEGSGSALAVHAGEFAIFYPQDAHLPSRVTAAGPRPVKKVVVKIPVL